MTWGRAGGRWGLRLGPAVTCQARSKKSVPLASLPEHLQCTTGPSQAPQPCKPSFHDLLTGVPWETGDATQMFCKIKKVGWAQAIWQRSGRLTWGFFSHQSFLFACVEVKIEYSYQSNCGQRLQNLSDMVGCYFASSQRSRDERGAVTEKWWWDEIMKRLWRDTKRNVGNCLKLRLYSLKPTVISLETDEILKVGFSHFIILTEFYFNWSFLPLSLYTFWSVDHRTTSNKKQFS